jgi:hypothetical protein
MMNPASWNASDVERWARQVGLSESTIMALSENEIDGPTLVTLEKDELRSELGIVSLPARRYIWGLILMLRSHQESSDRIKAIDVFEEEIESLPLHGPADASASGLCVMSQLWRDAAQQREIISDRLVALGLTGVSKPTKTQNSLVLNRIDSDRLASSLSSTGNMHTPLIEMVTNVLESRTRRIRDKLQLFLESQFKHVSAIK